MCCALLCGAGGLWGMHFDWLGGMNGGAGWGDELGASWGCAALCLIFWMGETNVLVL